MSHVKFKKMAMSPVTILKIPMSIWKRFNVTCSMAYVMSIVFFLMSIGSMSHVEFKKQPCRPVEFNGQRPFLSLTSGPFIS